jgi:hypothetical protein
MGQTLSEQVARLALAALDGLPPERTAEQLVALRCEAWAAIQQLQQLVGALDTEAIPIWPFGGAEAIEVPGHGAYRVSKTGQKISWDHPRAASAVVRAGLERDGFHHPQEVADLVMRTQTAQHGWKLAELKRLGIDPEKFRTVEGGRLIVTAAW